MRKKQAKKRPLLPDPKFNDQLVTRFVNMLMWDGKKSTAFKIFYDAIDIVEERKQDDPKKFESNNELPVSENIGKNGLYLPLGKHVNNSVQIKVVKSISSFFDRG